MEFETDSLLVINSLSSHFLDCSEYGFLILDYVCEVKVITLFGL